MFKQRTRVYHNIFKFLCERLGMYLHRKNTHMRKTIEIEIRVAMSLQRLGTRTTITEVYEVAEDIIS